jgi:DNA replication protein DnaC
LAKALAYRALVAGIKTRFLTADMMLQPATGHKQDQLKQHFSRAVIGPRSLLVDEMGFRSFGRDEANLFTTECPQRRCWLCVSSIIVLETRGHPESR